jgi:hypothetical protein
MWQRLVKFYLKLYRRFLQKGPVPAPVHDGSVLMITAYVKKGMVIVTYKGRVKTGYFDDNTLRNMVKGIKFKKNTESFVAAIVHLIQTLTEEIKH